MQWLVEIRVRFEQGTEAVCQATVFARDARAARRNGRELMEAVCRDGQCRVAGVTASPAPFYRSMTVVGAARTATGQHAARQA